MACDLVNDCGGFWTHFWQGFFKVMPHRHEIVHTGRHGIVLEQVRCTRCGRLFVTHLDMGGLLEWDWCMERYARSHGW